MQGFCGAAYEWFQAKYGMFCPGQCDKYQCRSTCAWLKEQGEHKDEEKSIAGAMSMSDATKSELEALGKQVATLKEEELKLKRGLEQAGVVVGRAQKVVDEANKDVDGQSARMRDFEQKRDTREAEEKKAATTLSDTKEALETLEFKLQEKGLDLKRMETEAERLTKKKAKYEGKLSKLDEEVQKGEDDKRALIAMKDDEAEKAVEAATAVEEQKAVVQEADNKITDAEKQFKVDKLLVKTFGEGGPGEGSPEFKKMVKELELRKKEQEDKLYELERVQRKMQQAVDLAQKEIDNFEADLAKVRNERNAMRTQVDDIEKEAAAKAKEAAKFEEGPIGQGMKQAKQMEEDITAMEKTLETAKITTKFANQAVDDQKATLDKAKSKAMEAKEMLEVSQASEDDAEEALKAKGEEIKGKEEEEATLKGAHDSHLEKLNGRIAENKKEGRRLDRTQPEIVRQHGLGLLSLLITGVRH